MTIFNNDKEGRTKILESIKRLEGSGYTRHDTYNVKVEMKKTVLVGKLAKKINIVEYIYDKAAVKIVENKRDIFQGVENIKSILYGFSSPSVEAKNAAKAGLLDDNDVSILKDTYSNREWLGAGE